MVGVEHCGGGKWADIKKLGFAVIAGRSAVDLKDKWRNLMRVALLPAPGSAKCARSGACCGLLDSLHMHALFEGEVLLVWVH